MAQIKDSDKLPPALLITRNLPPLVGGMERLVWHIADELRAAYSLHVVAPAGCEAQLPPGVTASGVALRPLWRFLLSSAWSSIRQALRLRPRLVFAGSGLTAPIAWLAARLAGGRCVVYLHGLDIEARHPAYRLLWHPFLRRCDRVITNSRFTHELAANIGIPRKRLSILHPGVHLAEVASADQQRQDFREKHHLGDAPLMLYVGRITERKGLLPFVRDILPAITATLPEARLLVIGEDPVNALAHRTGLRSEVQAALSASGLSDIVTWLPHVDEDELAGAYFAADVLVFPVQEIPSDPEGFGMVALEAAAHGLPTVAFAVGGVTDAIEQGVSGQLIKPADGQGFCDAVVRLLTTARYEGKTWSKEARAFATQYSWENFGRVLLAEVSANQRG